MAWPLRAVLVASALAAVFAARVFVSFDGLRVKLIREPVPVTAGAFEVDSRHDSRTASLQAPVAFIAVVANPDRTARQFSITVDGTPVCTFRVGSLSTERADCATARWTQGGTPTIGLAGDTPAWTLEFLEIATHHGSSTRLIPFHVLPATSATYGRPGPASAAVVLVLMLALCSLPTAVWPRRMIRIHQLLSGAVVAWLGAVVVAPWVSSFLLVMPVRSFVIVSAVLLAPQLAGGAVIAGEWLRRLVGARWLRRPAVAVTAVALFSMVPYGLVMRHDAREFDGNYTGLLRISQSGLERSPLFEGRADVHESLALLPNGGYDAQFMYFAAFDPLLRRFHDRPHMYRAVVDAPPYRFGRIGFPWMVRILAGTHWRWFPAVMIGLVLLGTGICAGATAWLAQRAGRSAAWGLLILAVPGFWQSVRVVLPEPLAAAALLLGCCLVMQRRFRGAALLFAASLLIRETGLVLLASLLVFLPAAAASWRDRAWLAAAVVPLMVWRIYVAAILWPDWGLEGLLYSADNVGLPLLGIVDLWSELARGRYYPNIHELIRAATWYPVILITLGGVAWTVRRALPRPMAVALGIYVVLALSLTFPVIWGHVGNAQRGSYEMFVLLAAGGVGASTHSRTHRAAILAGAVLSCLFILFGAHDALATREALFP